MVHISKDAFSSGYCKKLTKINNFLDLSTFSVVRYNAVVEQKFLERGNFFHFLLGIKKCQDEDKLIFK